MSIPSLCYGMEKKWIMELFHMPRYGLYLVRMSKINDLLSYFVSMSGFVFWHGKSWLVESFHVYIRFVLWYGKNG